VEAGRRRIMPQDDQSTESRLSTEGAAEEGRLDNTADSCIEYPEGYPKPKPLTWLVTYGEMWSDEETNAGAFSTRAKAIKHAVQVLAAPNHSEWVGIECFEVDTGKSEPEAEPLLFAALEYAVKLWKKVKRLKKRQRRTCETCHHWGSWDEPCFSDDGTPALEGECTLVDRTREGHQKPEGNRQSLEGESYAYLNLAKNPTQNILHDREEGGNLITHRTFSCSMWMSTKLVIKRGHY
jgi:hypothetical protein